MELWAEAFTNLRVPKIFNLRTDPFEKADITSNTYWDWMIGRERLADDLATIEAVRKAVGSDMSLMVDFNQGLHLGEPLERCHAIDDFGLAWIEESIVYDTSG